MARTVAQVTGPAQKAPWPLEGPFSWWPRASDALLALLAFLGDIFSGSFADPAQAQGFSLGLAGDFSVPEIVLLIVASAAIYWRRSRPLTVLTVALVMVTLWDLLSFPGDPGLGAFIALYSVGRYADVDRHSYLAVGAALVVMASSVVGGGESPTGMAFALAVVFLAWYIGRRVRARRMHLRLLQDRAEYLERERRAEAERAVTEERSRIARELHDVVAHRVSLMTVQAGAAKTVATADPAGALQAMTAVEEAGREALGELRHLLDVIRPNADGDGLGPQAGIADLPKLVDQLGQAGMNVALRIDGVPEDLPVRVDLSGYRIVQEALTNALKHAGPDAEVAVDVCGANGGIAIEVIDTGSGGTILPGAGHGLLGMRERAMLLGGAFEAGPRPGGGFRVAAQLPVAGAEP